MTRIAVVGAGISGLAIAFEIRAILHERGLALDLVVLESERDVGGKVRTIEDSGYLCEWGVQGFLDNSPPTLELAAALGLEPRLRRAAEAARSRWILKHGRLEPVPMGPGAFLRSRLLSFRGKARLLLEPFARKAPSGVDETVAEFARRRLGEEALAVLVGPMVSGVFAGDPDNLSLRSAFPKVAALEDRHGGLIRGMMALRKERGREVGPGPGGTLTSFDGGMALFCETLAQSLGGAIRAGSTVRSIVRTPTGFALALDGGHLEADAVVLAVPAYEQARLLGPLDSTCADLLGAIPYPPLAVLCLGYRRQDVTHPLDGFGFLVPRAEPRRILGALFESSLFDGRAPAGHVLVRVMAGGATRPEVYALDDASLASLAHEELRDLLGLGAPPVFTRVFRHDRAIPQYTRGHAQRLAEIEARASALGPIVLAGNAWRGIGLNDCVRAARGVAEAVLGRFGVGRA